MCLISDLLSCLDPDVIIILFTNSNALHSGPLVIIHDQEVHCAQQLNIRCSCTCGDEGVGGQESLSASMQLNIIMEEQENKTKRKFILIL